jgi:mitochondrial import receptor subunit TOM40
MSIHLTINQVFCQANVDNDFGLLGRFNWRWTSAMVTKSSVQLAPGPGQSMFSIEQDYTGADFSASVKAMNPSILEGGLTGIFIGDYLQSITPRLALGLNAMWQRAAMNTGPDTLVSYAARYKGDDWIASGQLVAAGGLQLSYWRRLAEKVEGGVDVNLQVAPGAGGGMMGGPMKREGTTTIGAKYNFRASSFRAQLDSQGRLGCLFEKHIAPAVSVTFSGEIDHVKVRLSQIHYSHSQLI